MSLPQVSINRHTCRNNQKCAWHGNPGRLYMRMAIACAVPVRGGAPLRDLNPALAPTDQHAAIGACGGVAKPTPPYVQLHAMRGLQGTFVRHPFQVPSFCACLLRPRLLAACKGRALIQAGRMSHNGACDTDPPSRTAMTSSSRGGAYARAHSCITHKPEPATSSAHAPPQRPFDAAFANPRKATCTAWLRPSPKPSQYNTKPSPRIIIISKRHVLSFTLEPVLYGPSERWGLSRYLPSRHRELLR